MTLCNSSSYSCQHYASMNSAVVRRRVLYFNCKHLYYSFRFYWKLDYNVDTYIYALRLRLDGVKILLVAAEIIKTEDLIMSHNWCLEGETSTRSNSYLF
jgi:hypothetical protein